MGFIAYKYVNDDCFDWITHSGAIDTKKSIDPKLSGKVSQRLAISGIFVFNNINIQYGVIYQR